MIHKKIQAIAQMAATPSTTQLLYKSNFYYPCVKKRPDHPLTAP